MAQLVARSAGGAEVVGSSPTTPTNERYLMGNNYRNFCIQLAEECGEIIAADFAFGMPKELKEDASPVTQTDRLINQKVIERINATYPEHAILGEEASDARRQSNYVWLCDPLDGTIPFTSGIPTFVFSLALVIHGVPTAGVAYDPILKRMYYAEKGMGATLNNQPIHVLESPLQKGAIVAVTGTSRYFDGGRLQNTLRNDGVRSVNVYSGIYEGMRVAAGGLAGAIIGTTAPYDAASIKVIVEEAGGTVTDVNGREQRYDQAINDCVASCGVAHRQLLEVVRESAATQPSNSS